MTATLSATPPSRRLSAVSLATSWKMGAASSRPPFFWSCLSASTIRLAADVSQ
jgi:hypothetical protein